MTDNRDAPDVTVLMRQVAELEARLQTIRQETADQVKNTMQEQFLSLELDAASSRERVRAVERENASLRGLLGSPSFAGPDQMVVQPYWASNAIGLERNAGFVLMPFRPVWAGAVYAAIGRALHSHYMRCDRGDDLPGRDVMGEIWRRICECGVVIADLTESNPNVTYEIGLADAIGRPSILLCQTARADQLPFDFLGQRLIIYSQDHLDDLEERLKHNLRALRPSSARVK
jgi:hypothetical protein